MPSMNSFELHFTFVVHLETPPIELLLFVIELSISLFNFKRVLFNNLFIQLPF